MKKFSLNQWFGIALILAAVIIWAPLPSFLSFLRALMPLVVVIIGLYELFK